MSVQTKQAQPRSRVKKDSSRFFIISALVVIIITAAFYFYVGNSPSKTIITTHGDVIATPPGLPSTTTVVNIDQLQQKAANSAAQPRTPFNNGKSFVQSYTTGTVKTTLPATPELGIINVENSQSADQTVSSDNEETIEIVTLSEGYTNTPQLIDNINSFYQHLDLQPYMLSYNLSTTSKIHFSDLLQNLVDNPPIVTRETDDLFTLLKNTAHFFRILGKENIQILKGILDREKISFEQTLKSFYLLTSQPEILRQEYSLTIPLESLYDYAGFFLNTMGGRLYLFRRDSTSRMAVSYYSILIIDRVKDNDSDHHGIDLIRPIDSLIEEIENAGKRLRLREEYIDVLYDLKEKYAR